VVLTAYLGFKISFFVYFKLYSPRESKIWFGLGDEDQTGVYHWEDQSLPETILWADGEPGDAMDK
jgi:hypothetical protein